MTNSLATAKPFPALDADSIISSESSLYRPITCTIDAEQR